MKLPRVAAGAVITSSCWRIFSRRAPGPPDWPEAERLLGEAARSGHAGALYELAVTDADDPSGRVRWGSRVQ